MPGFRLEEEDERLLLQHVSGGHMLALNQEAALVWRLCDGDRTLAEIIRLLQDAYPDSEGVEGDVMASATLLHSLGVLSED